MSTSPFANPQPFLRVSRTFPQDNAQLSVELDKMYIEIANIVNGKTSGLFTPNKPALTGENWYLSGSERQEGFRRIYTFTAAGNIPHGIDLTTIGAIVKLYGTFTDGTLWYPLPYVDTVAVANQISLEMDGTNIIITAGGGAPSITSGTVVIEWLANR